MSELSPAAQAVLTAYNQRELAAKRTTALAAALRAAADQANPKYHIEDIGYQHQSYIDGWKDAIQLVLAIAAELEAQ